MSVIGSNILAGAAGQGGGYVIENSLRFRGAYPATPSYLSRTAGTPTNNLKWTFSCWVKRGVLGVGQHLLNGGTGTSVSEDYLQFLGSDKLAFYQGNATTTVISTNAVYRDPSAWYHIVLVYDSAQATSTNRLFIYVNGVSQSFSSATYPTLNQATNINASGKLQRISSRTYAADEGLDGYLTEVNFIDGQALTPSDFGEYNATTGVWQPVAYEGTYGNNGFYLNFSDNTTTTTLAEDASGNGNDWTPSNISLTAGVTYDSMTDTPTPYADGGNYAVLNPLDKNNGTCSNGNLSFADAGVDGWDNARGTIGVRTGKWYWEFIPGFANTNYQCASIATDKFPLMNLPGSPDSNGITYYANGSLYQNASFATSWGATFTQNDVIGIALDVDSGKVWFSKNGTWQASGDPSAGTSPAASGLNAGPWFPIAATYFSGYTASFNFGQRPFAYTPPTGFKSLHTGNLPDSAIENGSEYFAAVLYTGTGAEQSITGLEFQPDLVWIKKRNTSTNGSHQLVDSVRGTSAYLFSDATNSEITATDRLTAFNSNGFTLSTASQVNGSADTFVGWNWKAGGAAVTNTAGSITSQVSASPTAGFSVVTYTGNGTQPSTVGHGLGVAPSIVIVKTRDSASYDWNSYHVSLGNTQYIALNTTVAASSAVSLWNNTSPTSTVFSLNHVAVNTSSNTYVAYCFSEVPGYSKFGSYTGNGSADGPFVYCGFRPRFVMIKWTNVESWYIFDTARGTYNVIGPYMVPNTSAAEGTYTAVDILSNGFKLRDTNNFVNSSGTYIYMAFAENPFKNSLAR